MNRMDDLISRQAAIDALEIGNLHRGIVDALQNIIAELPSAQQDLDEWCVDCKEYDQERHCCPRFNAVIRTTIEEIKGEHSLPAYEELTPEEAASEIASGSVMPTLYWFDIMIRLKQMGYVICRKK